MMSNNQSSPNGFPNIANKSPPKMKPKHSIKLPSVLGSNNKGNSEGSSGYVCKQLLGEGGFAKVKRGVRTKDGLQVVLKVFQKFRLTNEQKKRNIVKEIEMMRCLKHKNIITIIDAFETQDSISIVMEYFSKTSLYDFAKDNRPLPEDVLRKIIKQIAETLAFLHKMKIAHRDIKPENILINQFHQIKLIDLGLTINTGSTHQIKIAGTPQYMAPELKVKSKNYDPYKADIWAFGVTIYWLVEGYYPQRKQSLKKHSQNTLKQILFPKDINPGIHYLLMQMLNQEPKERISAQQIIENTWIKPKDFKSEIDKLKKQLLQ